jgi:hypothetical protein
VSNPDDFALRYRGIASTSDSNWENFQGLEVDLAEDLSSEEIDPDDKEEDFGIERF